MTIYTLVLVYFDYFTQMHLHKKAPEKPDKDAGNVFLRAHIIME